MRRRGMSPSYRFAATPYYLAPYGRRLRLLPRRRVVVEAGPPVDLARFAGRDLDKATCSRRRGRSSTMSP